MSNVTELLGKYGCMERSQLARMLVPEDPAMGRAYMSDLAINRLLLFKHNLVQLNIGKTVNPDPDMIASIWVMLLLCEGHMKQVVHDPSAHPFTVRFTADNNTYSILPVDETTPANVLAYAPERDTVLVLLRSGHVPDELNIPKDANVVYITYTRPDKWGKPFIHAFADRALTKEA